MDGTLVEILAWLEPRALLLAIVVPPVIRLVGHLIPEEPFMVAIGMLAARSGSANAAATLIIAAASSHLVADQTVYLVGCWLRARLSRYPRIGRHLQRVTGRLAESPGALLGLIPARVLPLGRGAWLAGCGVAGVPWPRFLLADVAALTVYAAVWSGLGWWLAGDVQRLESTIEAGRWLGAWLASGLAVAAVLWIGWLQYPRWRPATVRMARRLGASLRRLGWSRLP